MTETQPLLSGAALVTPEVSSKNEVIVDFDPNGDQDNPMDWPRAYKMGIVALLAFMAFNVTFTCISLVPVANDIIRDLNRDHLPDKAASVLLVTIWELGEAAGPLLIGPLSEIFGRRHVINVANTLFAAAVVLAACSQNKFLFITARCLNGVAVASNVLNPAIVGDMFPPEQRGSAMSTIMLAPLIGGAIGPAIAGAIAESLGWRQILWMSAILTAICEMLFLCCFRETYRVIILRRKAAKLRQEAGPYNYRTIYDNKDSDKRSNSGIWSSILRPFHVLFGSGVLQAICLFSGMSFTYFYIISTTLPDILEGIYGLTPAMTGLCFVSFSIGSSLCVLVCNRTLDRIYIKLRDANGGIGQAEYRLPLVILGSLTTPTAVIIYGWIAQYQLPLPVILTFLGIIGFTMIFCYLPLMAYVVDALGLYSASGMTAVIVIRCLMGTFFPLTTEPLVRQLGWGGGFTVLGAISLVLSPIPMLVFRYGAKWRQGSIYTRSN